MKFTQFVEKVTDGVQKYLGADVEVSVRNIRKNNGVQLTGMTIFGKESNLSPTIYLDFFFEDYENGKPLSEVVKDIIDMYDKSKVHQKVNIDFFQDYEKVEKQIFCKLINYEKNSEMLKSMPHEKYQDLAIVCYFVYTNDFIGNGTIMICNEHLETWQIDKEKLFERAMENTELIQGYRWTNMMDIMREMIIDSLRKKWYSGMELEEDLTEEQMEDIANCVIAGAINQSGKGPMYIMTNRSKFWGAVCMLNQEALEEVAELSGTNLIILPSSVHEIILMPETDETEYETLRSMVRDINASQVEPQEVLSDNIYLYDRGKRSVTVL